MVKKAEVKDRYITKDNKTIEIDRIQERALVTLMLGPWPDMYEELLVPWLQEERAKILEDVED